MKLSKYKNDKGFTLIELIVVIVIIAILTGVTIIGVSSWVSRARLAADYKNADTMEKTLGIINTDSTLTNWILREKIHANLYLSWVDDVNWSDLTFDSANNCYLVKGKKYVLGHAHTQLGWYDESGVWRIRTSCRDMTDAEMFKIMDKLKVYLPTGLPKPSNGTNYSLSINTNPDTGEFEVHCYAHKLVAGKESWYNGHDADITGSDVTY